MNKLSLILIYVCISLAGCLKDNPVEYPKVELTNTIEMLSYLEASGDYINSASPSVVDCEEVYNNISDYLILDVRNKEVFSAGHIHGAINLSNDSLYSYLENYSTTFRKIVIVSETGHSSCYYTSLLRLAGFQNVYSMKFGMSYWNSDFAGKWIESIAYYPDINRFVDYDSYKNKEGSLPSLSFTNEQETVEEKTKERIRYLLKEGFQEDEIGAKKIAETTNLITIEKIYDDFELQGQSNIYIICYGPEGLYKSLRFDPIPNTGHPEGTVLYKPGDFRSVSYLQTLPLEKPIAIYDYNGQTAAFITAYLRLLGYNAKTIPYGASHLFHYRLEILNHPEAFYTSMINNLPYDK